LANGIEMLQISANIMGEQNIIHPTLLWDEDEVILVDAGFPGQLPKIREAMEKAGAPLERLSKIIITHHDIDHIGSLASILKELPQRVEIIAHEEEIPYIQGERQSVKMNPDRMAQPEAQLNSLPEEQRQLMKKMFGSLKDLKASVDRSVDDGEILPYCGEITVIHTPGHTPGHICLYLKQSKILIAGDTLFVDGPMLVRAPLFIDFDVDLADKSLKKLAQYDIEAVVCYHGGLYKGNVNRRIAELTNG